MLVEQAIFTSADTGRRDGYQLVATTAGVSEADLRALASRGPSHDSLWETGDDAMSVNFFALPSGGYCVSKTTPTGQEHARRRGLRVYTQCLVVSSEVLAAFGNNALALLNAAFGQGYVRVLDEISGELEPFRLCGRATAVDEALLASLLSDPGVLWLEALIEAALSAPRVALLAPNCGSRLLAGLINCLPVECRLDFSFSTGLKYSPRRPLRIVCLGGHLAEQRRLARRYGLTMVEVFGKPPQELTATSGWGGFIASAIAAGKTAFLAEQLSIARPGLKLSDLDALGDELLEAMAQRSEESSDVAAGALVATVANGIPETRRADAAHARFARPVEPTTAAANGWAVDPAQIVGEQCPAAIEKLELLDDTVFEAIAGKPGSLEQLRTLWPQVLSEVGPDLVEESREQYLRHALRVWQDCVEGDRIHNPVLALATMEVICLLFGDR